MSNGNHGQVLLVGDLGGASRTLCDALLRQGFDVAAAAATGEALDWLRGRSADVLVADAALVKGDAKALLKGVRETAPDLPVIVLASEAETEAASDVLWAGANDWARKPLRLAEAVPKIARCAEASRLRRENAELRRTVALQNLAQAIAFSGDLEAVLERVADAAIERGPFDEASIMLPEGAQGLRIALARGPGRQGLVGQTVPWGAGVAGWVAANLEPLILHGPLGDPRIRPLRPPRPDIRCSMVVPMLAEGKLVGVLNVNATRRTRPLASAATQDLSLLASAVAPSIEHSRLLRQLREAEEKFRAIFENAVEGLYQKSLDGRFLAANPALADIFDYASAEDFIAEANASPAGIYADVEDARRMKETLEESGEIRDAEVRARRRDGSLIWIRETARLVLSTPDTPACCEGSIEDITAKHLAEERLRASEANLRHLLERSADGMVVVDEAGAVCYANPAALGLFGRPIDGMVGAELGIPLAREGCSEMDVLRPDGTLSAVELRAAAATWEGRPAYLVSLRDMTERKRAEARRALTHDVLDAINRSGDAALAPVLEIIVRHLGLDGAAFRLCAEDGGVPVVASVGLPEEFLQEDAIPSLPEGRDDDPPARCRAVLRGLADGDAPWTTAAGSFWTCGETLLPPDEAPPPPPCGRGFCAKWGYQSMAAVPLRTGSETVGLLQAYHRRPGMFDGETVELLESLGHSVGVALGRQRAQQALRASERRFRVFFDNAADAIVIQDPDGCILEANAEACNRLGYDREELLGMKVEDILPRRFAAGARARLASVFKEGREVFETEHLAKNGGQIPTEISARAIEFDGAPAVLSVARDISARKTMEEQIRQMQKLNAVGHLAGGVAHDFNNILTGISGLAQIVMDNLPEDSQDREDMDEIRQLALRGANLTRQLLAFSRRQPIKPQLVDLNEVVSDLSKMLRRLIGEDVEFEFAPGENLGAVLADPGQMEQVLMNLAVNARDAMPDGGTLTVETCNAALDEEYCRRHAEAKPGEHVMMAVSDTGGGMDSATRQRIFEPFFTTKPLGKGTGLGLATAYGIVKQHGGSIWVYSEAGRGTTFKIYLPRAQTAQADPGAGVAPQAIPRGRETVLLVEDEAPVRIVAERCLEALGYRVLAAASPAEALEEFGRFQEGAALLLTDVVMPGLNGVELYERLREKFPALRVLYMSGYTDRGVVNQKIIAPGAPFLQKPFDPEGLARAVREALDE